MFYRLILPANVLFATMNHHMSSMAKWRKATASDCSVTFRFGAALCKAKVRCESYSVVKYLHRL
jgi:hypothetical protein